MQIVKFADQFELLAEALGTTTASVRKRLATLDGDYPRWIAVENGRGLGEAVARTGPDRRARLSVTARDSTAYRPLVHTAVAALNTDVYANVSGSDLLLRRAFTNEGFRLAFTEDVFAASFDKALTVLRGATVPQGFTLITADKADGRSWFTLDNTLRQDVAGCEGWRGDLKWFAGHHHESPHFDPSAHVIAVDDTNGEYAGLARLWNGPRPQPRLGMLGVLRQYRREGLGKALLAKSLAAAAAWGPETFTGASARDAKAMRTLWIAMGGTEIDSEQTLVLRRA